MEKVTLAQAIHDLKIAFRKRFGSEKTITPDIEQAINLAAVRVKKGEMAEWNEENDKVYLSFYRPRRRKINPQAKPKYNPNFKKD